MADSSLPVTPGSGTSVDGRTESTNGNFRQVVVIGDPSANDNVVSAVTADPGPSSTAPGIVMRLAGSAAVQIVGSQGTIGTHLTGTDGTIWVKTDPDATLGGIRSSVAVHVVSTAGTITTKTDPDSTIGAIRLSVTPGTGSGHLGKAVNDPSGATDTGVAALAVVRAQAALSEATNDYANLSVSSQGGLRTVAESSNHAITDGHTNTVFQPSVGGATPINAKVFPMVFNGTDWDRLRGTTSGLTVGSIASSVAIHVLSTGGTIAVQFGNEPRVISSGKDGTTTRSLRMNSDGAIKVYDIAAGTVSVSSIASSVAVHLLTTGGTIVVKLDPASAGLATDDAAFNIASGTGSPMMALLDDTATDTVNEGDAGIVRMTSNRILMTQTAATSSIFTVSGSTSGGTTSGVTLVAPSSAYNFKVFAYSIQTTGIVSSAIRFTNGAGSETELWRPLITAAASSSSPVGANLAVSPPGFIFATGTNTTLALKNDSGSLVHYSVSYIKESA
jgi:hypothetical protein